MTTVTSCPQCRQNLQVTPELVGTVVRCPGCQHTFTAAGDDAVPSGPPPLPSDHVPPWDQPAAPAKAEAFERPLEEGDERKDNTPPKKRRERSRDGTAAGGVPKPKSHLITEHRGAVVLV